MPRHHDTQGRDPRAERDRRLIERDRAKQRRERDERERRARRNRKQAA